MVTLFAVPSVCVTFIAACWHTASQPPHPVQRPVSTTSSAFSNRIAFSVQLRQHAPHSTQDPASKVISASLNAENALRSSRWPGTTLQAWTSSRGTCISARRAVLTSLTGICLNAHAASPRRRSARFSRAIASNQSGFCSASILIKRTWCCACHSRSSFTPGARSVNGPTSVSPHRKRFRGVMPVMASAGQTNRQSPHSMQRLSSTETPESVKKKPAQDRRPRRRGRKRGENGDGRTHASRPSPGQRSIRPSANTEENEAQHQFTDNQQRASQQHGRSRRFQTARSKAQHTRNGYAPAQQMHVSQLLQHL